MDKRALILDGRLGEDAIAAQARQRAESWFSERQWTVTTHTLCDLEIAPCLGCFGCWIKTPGECVIADVGREIARDIVGSDVVVYLSPIQFGGYSHQLKKALDRSIPIISPLFRKVKREVHHKKRYHRYPKVVALGWVDRHAEDERDTFEILVRRNAINMHAPKSVVEILDPADTASIDRRVDWALGEGVGR